MEKENLTEKTNCIKTTTLELVVKETDWLKGDIESLSHADSKVKEFGAKHYPNQIWLTKKVGDNTTE